MMSYPRKIKWRNWEFSWTILDQETNDFLIDLFVNFRNKNTRFWLRKK